MVNPENKVPYAERKDFSPEAKAFMQAVEKFVEDNSNKFNLAELRSEMRIRSMYALEDRDNAPKLEMRTYNAALGILERVQELKK